MSSSCDSLKSVVMCGCVNAAPSAAGWGVVASEPSSRTRRPSRSTPRKRPPRISGVSAARRAVRSAVGKRSIPCIVVTVASGHYACTDMPRVRTRYRVRRHCWHTRRGHVPLRHSMNVTILGSGVIGVSVAYNLAKAGHQVLVVERQPGAGLETSFGNAGEISPGYAAPWAGPRIPLKALRWAFMRYRPLVVWPLPDPAMWRWMWQMLRNCTSARYDVNKTRMLRLAEYSRDCLRELRAETGIRYSERSRGTLQLFRTQRDLDASRHDTAILDRHGVRWERLDRDGCVGAEPALARVRD